MMQVPGCGAEGNTDGRKTQYGIGEVFCVTFSGFMHKVAEPSECYVHGSSGPWLAGRPATRPRHKKEMKRTYDKKQMKRTYACLCDGGVPAEAALATTFVGVCPFQLRFHYPSRSLV